MLPFRAVVQALGGLCFWDEKEQSVTIVTWRETPPPTKQTVKKVTVYKGKNYADVVYVDGQQKRVYTEKPAMIHDPRDGGWTLDVIEWFRLWGVPDENILFDPQRGGIAVRAASGAIPCKASGYIYFYQGETKAWNNFYERSVFSKQANPLQCFMKDGRIYSGAAAKNAVMWMFGRVSKTGPYSIEMFGLEMPTSD